jgi:hypothetical protein
LNFDLIEGVLFLEIDPDSCVTFREEWIEYLNSIPYEQFGVFIRDNIYPAFTDKERKIWHKASISNRDLLSAIQLFQTNNQG